MKIKFENPSVSGISRMYPGFRLHIPGHAIDAKAVILDVPDEYVENVKDYLKTSAPVITVTALDVETAESEAAQVQANAQAQAEEAAEKAAKEKAEAEAAQAAAMRPHGRRGGR